jgi:hypothetical protein
LFSLSININLLPAQLRCEIIDATAAIKAMQRLGCKCHRPLSMAGVMSAEMLPAYIGPKAIHENRHAGVWQQHIANKFSHIL